MPDEPGVQVAVDGGVVALGHAIRELASEYGRMAQHMRAASDVNDTEFVALTVLSSAPGLTAGELADRLHRSPAATSSVIEHLEEVGHLRRARDPSDRRRVTLWLTDQPNRVAMTALAPLLARLQDEFLDDPEGTAEAERALGRVRDVMADFLDDLERVDASVDDTTT